MKRLFFLFLVFLFSTVFSEEDDFVSEPNSLDDPSCSLTSLEGEPSAIVHNCVNTITGEYIDFQTDITIPGIQGLTLQRFFSSSDRQLSKIGRVWKFNHDISLSRPFLSPAPLYFSDGFGGRIPFDYARERVSRVHRSALIKRTTNSGARQARAGTQLSNYTISQHKNYALVKKGIEGLYSFKHLSLDGEERIRTVKMNTGNRIRKAHHCRMQNTL